MVCSIERLVLGCRVEEENCLPLLSLNCPGSDFKLWGMPFYEKNSTWNSNLWKHPVCAGLTLKFRIILVYNASR